MITLVKNAKIWVKKEQFVEAILMEDGFIKAVGKLRDLVGYPHDQVMDLKNKTVLPGFNDGHLHMMMTGEMMRYCNLTQAKSIQEVIHLGKTYLKENPNTTLLVGFGWNQDNFTQEQRLLTRYDLDAISTSVPIVFKRSCMHVNVCNSKAIELANIQANSVVSEGIVGVDKKQQVNGILYENASSLLDNLYPKPTQQTLEQDHLRAAKYALSLGITSVNSNDVLLNDASMVFSAISTITKHKKTPLRYRPQVYFKTLDQFDDYIKNEHNAPHYDDLFVSKGCLKLFKDGSLGARTAHLQHPYQDDPSTKGIQVMSDETFLAFCQHATANNIQVVTHAIGDAAIESVLNVYEQCLNNHQNPLRHAIIHFQVTNPTQLKRAAAMHIPIIYQPIFLHEDHKIIASRVGTTLANTSYAFNTMYQSKACVSFSSDSPIEDCNPLLGIQCAITRKDLNGYPQDGYNRNEAMSLEDALDAYTFQSAFSQGTEHQKGMLLPGYVADFIVLDQDIFEIDPHYIKDIHVLSTIIHGEVVYTRSLTTV